MPRADGRAPGRRQSTRKSASASHASSTRTASAALCVLTLHPHSQEIILQNTPRSRKFGNATKGDDTKYGEGAPVTLDMVDGLTMNGLSYMMASDQDEAYWVRDRDTWTEKVLKKVDKALKALVRGGKTEDEILSEELITKAVYNERNFPTELTDLGIQKPEFDDIKKAVADFGVVAVASDKVTLDELTAFFHCDPKWKQRDPEAQQEPDLEVHDCGESGVWSANDEVVHAKPTPALPRRCQHRRPRHRRVGRRRLGRRRPRAWA